MFLFCGIILCICFRETKMEFTDDLYDDDSMLSELYNKKVTNNFRHDILHKEC